MRLKKHKDFLKNREGYGSLIGTKIKDKCGEGDFFLSETDQRADVMG